MPATFCGQPENLILHNFKVIELDLVLPYTQSFVSTN